MADTVYDADVIIVGSGVIGGLAAQKIAKAGKSVIILEAGPRVPRWEIVEAFRNSGNVSSNGGNRNQPYPNVPWAPTSFTPGYVENTGPIDYNPYTLRLVGGTTWHWGGACWRNLPNDFKMKTVYGVGRDFPLTYDELEPFYYEAELEMGISGDNTADYSGHGGAPYPPRAHPYPIRPQAMNYFGKRFAERVAVGGFHYTYQSNGRATDPCGERPACVGNNNCSPICPIGAQYSGDRDITKAEQYGAKVISNAAAYKLETSPDGKRIVAVNYHDPDKNSHRLTAKYFIVAANAIETPRLLLLSDVANSSGMVGRNLMDHHAFSMTLISDEPMWSGRGPVQQGDILNRRDGPWRSDHSSIRYEIGNGVGNVDVARSLLGKGIIGPELDRQIRHMSARWTPISAQLEHLPQPQNRITLSAKNKDMFGQPLLSIHFEVTDYERRGYDVVMKDYLTFQQLLGAEVFSKNTSQWENRAHPMGTVIMGEDPKDSVVNHECRTFDHQNLFLTTTGVMPAGAANNPTVTGCALSLKAAGHILAEI